MHVPLPTPQGLCLSLHPLQDLSTLGLPGSPGAWTLPHHLLPLPAGRLHLPWQPLHAALTSAAGALPADWAGEDLGA